MLTEWRKPVDNAEAVRYFARELLNEWVNKIASVQQAQSNVHPQINAVEGKYHSQSP